MAEFFKTSRLWVVDFRYEGHPRRWFKTFPAGVDAAAEVQRTLQQWYGDRARLLDVREADEAEEMQYVRGEKPVNAYCPAPGAPPRP